MENKTLNIVVAGVGGQGVITLLKILGEAALSEERKVRTAELHGLSQKGGSVRAHVRVGGEPFSPLIGREEADLVLALEMAEGVRSLFLASEETALVINEKTISFRGAPSKEETSARLEKRGRLHLVPASEVCKKELGKEIVAGVYLLSFAREKGFLPFSRENLLKAVKKVVPPSYREINEKSFQLAQSE